MRFRSLYNRLIVAFIFMAITISVLYGLLVYNAMKYTEDDILTRRIEMEAQYYLREYSIDREAAKLPDAIGLNSYLSTSADLPAWLKQQPLGTREIHDKELHVGVNELPNNDGLLYIVLNEAESSSFEKQQSSLFLILFLMGVAITINGVVVAVVLGKYITSPLNRLTSEIDVFELTDPIAGKLPFYGAGRHDEVGSLSRAFTNLVYQLGQFLEREKQFTQHASHELRTPLTVINNALAVIRLDKVAVEIKERNIDRIGNATQDMTDLINTFLYLGRDKNTLVKERLDISQMVRHCLEKYAHLDERQHLNINANIPPHVGITNDANLVQILLENIVRNMYLHSQSIATITLDEKKLRVKNDINPDVVVSNEFRETPFGLKIIERISERCQLKTTIYNIEGCFVIDVEFSSSKS